MQTSPLSFYVWFTFPPRETLSQKEEKVIRLRFVIGCEREHTLEEIGQEFDVTRERTRQIEAKALRQLRAPERALMAAR